MRVELFVADLDASVAFYVDVLGFTELESAGPYRPLVRDADRISLQSVSELPADHPLARPGSPGLGLELVLEVDDIEALYRRARDRWPIAAELGERPWGLTDFRVIDPDGYYWRLTSPEQLQPRTADGAQPQTAEPVAVTQLRLVVEARDFDGAVTFYRDALGMAEEFSVESEGGALVTALRAGRATLELVNPAQRRLIDQLEVGRDVSRDIRVAFEISDAPTATDRLVAAGAELIAPPTHTPWDSLNSRLEAPAGLQITLFEELSGQDPRTDPPSSPGPTGRSRT